ncbi:MAG: hypothetical protein HKN79_02580 [Flavobacteriales bacterium]|nr:hypothetical protein [Flavobacteriales bacterium]
MPRIRHISSLLLCMLGLLSFAGGEIQPRGAQSMAMGNNSVMLTGLWSGFNNQAGLVGLTDLHAGVYYHNLFSVGGLADQGFIVAYGDGQRSVAINVSTFGQEVFSDDRFGLAYGMKLGEKLDMGIQLNYHSKRIQFDEYGSHSTLTAEIGLISHLTDDFDLAFHLFNPWQSTLLKNELVDERIPTVMSIGGAYRFSDKVQLVSEVTKDLDMPTVLRAGIEYRVVEVVYLRGGISTEPTLSSFGAGVDWNALRFDVAASYHHVLGYSTQLSLSYRFNDGKN